MSTVVGRELELAAIGRFFTRHEQGTRALLLEGEAGIGKTTLWSEGIAAALEHGHRLLACRTAEAERGLAFAGLSDLFGEIVEREVRQLPSPQRRALEVALLLADAGEDPPDERAVSAAALNALRLVAQSGAVLVAIDDVQWLDPASAAALTFAFRRLSQENVVLLGSWRHDADEPVPLELARSLPPERLQRLDVQSLSIGALHHLVRTRLGFALSRPSLLRVHERSGGNPFYALEIARALRERQEHGLEDPPALPATLLDLVRDRLDRLPAPLMETLALAALVGSPPLALIGSASEEALPSIEVAEAEGIVETKGGTVRFTHPLLASAVLSRVSRAKRRSMHRRLAALVEGEEAQAHHLALGAERPSRETAKTVEVASERAAGRGAPAAAAELAEHAARLTPADASGERHRRELAAAWYYVVAGSSERGWTILDGLLGVLPPGRMRARALLFMIESPMSLGRRLDLLEQAGREAEGDDALLGQIHRDKSESLMLAGRLQEALACARSAARLAERAGDDVLLVQSLGTLAHYETYGADITPGLLEHAVELEQATPGTSSHYSPAQILGLRLLYADRLEEARDWIQRILTQARDDGYEAERLNVLVHLVQLEIRAGRWQLADEYAAEAEVLADQLQRQPANAAFARALVDAHRGREESARAAAESGWAAAEDKGDRLFALLNRWALGFLQLSCDEFDAAAQTLDPLATELEAMGYRNPGVRPLLPDAIEALLAVGALERARPLLDELETRGNALGNPWALAAAARGRGLLAAAEGKTDEAVTALASALAQHERAASPFERARTQLALGAVLRRAKQKRSARETLELALTEFERLGAPLWAAKARSEMARIGGRGPATDGLTPSEQQVAELVAQGRSNSEVAAALFVTPGTVEKHLSKVYTKLGVRSRSELASRFADVGKSR